MAMVLQGHSIVCKAYQIAFVCCDHLGCSWDCGDMTMGELSAWVVVSY